MAELRFDGRVAIITGAGAGMGRVHALMLASRGASIVVCDAGITMGGEGGDPGVAEKVVEEIRAGGGSAVSYTSNLLDDDAARGTVHRAMDAFARVDIVIHNAGLAAGEPFEKESVVQADRILGVNIRAGSIMVREAWPHMLAARYGRIVLTGSTAWYGMAYGATYAASKIAFVGLARSLALEGADHNIKVNVLGPSGATRMAEAMAESEFKSWFLRTMKPELVSAVVAYLSHEDCAVTGETLIAAGGKVARMILAESPGIVDDDLKPETVRDRIDEIIGIDTTTPFGSYPEAAGALMRSLGFNPTEDVSKVVDA